MMRSCLLLLAGAAFAAASFAQTPEAASAAARQEASAYQLRIPVAPLAEALSQFGVQTGYQVVYQPELVLGMQSKSVAGKLTVDAALDALLKGTGLVWDRVNGNTVVVKRAKEVPPVAMMLTDASASRAEEPEAAVRADGSDRGIPEILVRDSKVLNTDIRRTEDDPQPYVVFDRETIERSMADNVADFLKSRLPMNGVQNMHSQTTTTMASEGNQSLINLRGSGASQTLILVNGRRMPNVSRLGASNQPDINGIPLASIERIEVLPSTASGIYGGGATGGVVNVITRKDYDSVDVSMTYGNVFRSDAGERRVDLSTGFSLGRTQVLINGSYADANDLQQGDRDFLRRARALQLRNNPAALLEGALPPLGYTTNIMSADGSNLVLKDGTDLGSWFTSVPVGYAGADSDGGLGLVRNAGRYNLDLPNDVDGLGQSVVSKPRVRSASVNLRRSFGARVEAYADASLYDNFGASTVSAAPSFAEVADFAPNNPFATPVFATFPAAGISDQMTSGSETVHLTGGVIVRLPAAWTAALDYVWSLSTVHWEQPSSVGDPDTIYGPQPSVDDALYYGDLDILRDVNRYRLDYGPYLMGDATLTSGPSESTMRDANLRLSGPVFSLPGGPLTLSTIAAWRKSVLQDDFQEFFDQYEPSGYGAYFFPRRWQTVNSYYAEVRAPLVSAVNARRGAQELELQLSARHDRYRTTAPVPGSEYIPSRESEFPQFSYNRNAVSATRYTLGFKYAPVRDVAFRASLGTGFLPPAVNQIGIDSVTYAYSSIVDSKRGGVPARLSGAQRIFGGEPNLSAEQSRSLSAGLIFTPGSAPGLRLSVDYTRIRETDDITLLTLQQLVDLEDYLPGKVRRAALTPADMARGYTGGVITYLDQTLLNLAETLIEAYDFQADYAFGLGGGMLHLYALGTWQPRYDHRLGLGTPAYDSTGYAGGHLEWRGNLGATWEQGPWTADWNMQYFDRYRVYEATFSAQSRLNAALNQGADYIPRQLYHDVSLRYRFSGGAGFAGRFLEDTSVSLGMQNVFNTSPPILATTLTSGGYSTYGDPRMRRYTIGFRKTF